MKFLTQWWKTNFLPLEFWFAVLLSIIFVVWAEAFQGKVIIDNMLDNNRNDVYSALAAIFGSLLGFTITSVSIVLGYSTSERLSIVRESKHYSLMWKVFTSAIKALAAATIVSFLGLVIDRNSDPSYIILYLNVLTAILASFRLARCVWVLDNIIQLVTAPPKS